MTARVLIVEDDPLVSSFIERGLRAAGFRTRIASDGLEAERLSLANGFDLLILDMALPGRSGFQVLQTLRARGSDMPVVVLTGRPELKDAVGALGVSPEDYIPKPFHFAELLARARARTAEAGGTALSASVDSPSGDPGVGAASEE